MSAILDLISNFIEITGNSIADNIILAVIGVISFMVAFGIVGMVFDALGVYDSDLMSGCHWIVRIIVFVGLSAVCIGIAKFIAWLFSFQWWVYLIALIVIVGVVVLIHFLKHRHSKKKYNTEAKPSDEAKVEVDAVETKTDRDHCPRCGGLLVKRHGPYGDFYGCENYPVSNCRYTRRIK